MPSPATAGTSPARSAATSGVRAAMPLAVAIVPFGLVYGVAVADSPVSGWVGGAASWIVVAGAAQLSLLSLIDSDAAWVTAVGTALVINARFVLYSTALAPAFSEFPVRWRLTLPYFLTDQAASVALIHFDNERDPLKRRWFYLAASLSIVVGWWIGTVAGILVGGSLPDEVDIGFAVPAMFIALVVPAVVDHPALVAAVVAAGVTVLAAGLPNGTNIIAGAVAGIGVGSTLGGSET